jgi:hypothetical protein
MIDSFFRFIFEKELKKQSLDSVEHKNQRIILKKEPLYAGKILYEVIY